MLVLELKLPHESYFTHNKIFLKNSENKNSYFAPLITVCHHVQFQKKRMSRFGEIFRGVYFWSKSDPTLPILNIIKISIKNPKLPSAFRYNFR